MELMVVVGICGILAAIAMTGLSVVVPGYRLNSATQMLRSDILEAKVRAASILRDVGVGPNVAKTEWSLQLFDATPLASGQTFQGVTRKMTEFGGVEIDTMPDVIFRSNGTARQAYTVVLKHPKAGSRTITVSLTGRVRIQ
ncbi:MAG: hypothetical protein JEZ02_16015 [Desulfatibacillum sp.]|nr:hypothetical protein [Desulfatibacillum sp.]